MKKVLKLVAIVALSAGNINLYAMFNQGQPGMPNVQQNQFVQPFNPMAYAQQPYMVPGMPMQMPYQVTTTTTYYQPFVVYPFMQQTTTTYFQPLFMPNQQPVAQPMLQQMPMAIPPAANNVLNNVIPAAPVPQAPINVNVANNAPLPPAPVVNVANNAPALPPAPASINVANNVVCAVAPRGDEVTVATETERTCNCPVEAVASVKSDNTELPVVVQDENESNNILAHNPPELLTTAEDSNNILPPPPPPALASSNELSNAQQAQSGQRVLNVVCPLALPYDPDTDNLNPRDLRALMAWRLGSRLVQMQAPNQRPLALTWQPDVNNLSPEWRLAYFNYINNVNK